MKDYECNCGKYKRMKHRGVVCENAGVEVIQSKVRRERLGHIARDSCRAHLVLKSLPSRIGTCSTSRSELEKVLYCEPMSWSSRDVGTPGRRAADGRPLPKLVEELGGEDAFIARMGADAIRDLLRKINIHQLRRKSAR